MQKSLQFCKTVVTLHRKEFIKHQKINTMKNLRTVFEVYPGSRRPARVIEENVTVERSREIINDLCHGNSILEENYAIQDGTVEESTYIDDNGLWQWK